MEIKYRLYPYPVLSTYSDDYQSGKFNAVIEPRKEGYHLRVDFTAELTNDALKKLIRSGQAKYVYHMECAQTGFRKVFQTGEVIASELLSDKNLNGTLQICSFIVAVEDIQGYSSEDFHEDYRGISFDIEAGCIMASGKMVAVHISKDVDELEHMPSIFSIARNADDTCKHMMVDYSGRKIVIKLPMDDYYSYKQLSKTPQIQAVLNSLTIVPALIYVLGELKRVSVSEREENAENLWYRVLAKTLATKFDCDISSEEFEEQDVMRLAQSLINEPVSDAFKMLAGFSGGDDE
ncbi:hypothetical protein H1B31_01950 [Selenomonas timonae]|uniref:Uncharacterized protein n=1 Tax=Selenomonas timonae TaxID=2754044 RepID=A0A7G7VKV5_9FIRM|nr:hypothetical protein [Selenomonas timonae]QNH54748.1 hypothetical protein H1B31_01950 [Selenomonas timonae]